MATLTPLSSILLVSVSVGLVVALLAWRERPEPGATPLAVMLAGQFWWSACLVFQLEAATLPAKSFWVSVSWVGVVVIPVAWLLFALEYTGRDQYVRPRYVLALSVVPALTVVIAFTGQYHDLLYGEFALVDVGGRAVIDETVGPWYWLIAGYTYLLGLLGSIPLLGLVSSKSVPFRGQGAALLVGTLAPWVSNALFLSGAFAGIGPDPTPVAFSVSGVAYFAAITRFRLFGTSPSPNRRARRLVFERMHEGAIVVDSHDYVVDMNENAAKTLGVDAAEAIGHPAAEVIPDYAILPPEGQSPEHLSLRTDRGTQFYDATVTRIDDYHGRSVGRVITFHDIGDLLRQQQRLEVLNRVLRHNIRTETNLITGYADLVGEDGDERTGQIKEHARRIEEMGEKAREVSDVFDGREAEDPPASLRSLLEESIERVADDYPDTDFECEPVPDDVRVSGVLAPVFDNLVENAVEHNTSESPEVRIAVDLDGDSVRVSVADNGPGITDYERSVLERGTETQLEHGSGLGLWLIKWGTNIAGGSVTFVEGPDGGSTVMVDVPVLAETDGESDPDRATS